MASYTVAFAGAEHDLGARGVGVPPDRCYVIACTPRSGSNMLGDILRQCGAALPMEYLELDAAMPLLARRFGTDDFAAYLAHLFSVRTTADGLFGCKVHWHQLMRFFTALNHGRPMEPGQEPVVCEVMDQLFPRLSWIHLRRDDVERQARSLHRAEVTGAFADLGHGHEVGTTVPEPTDHEVGVRRRQLEAWDGAWEQFFAVAGLTPHRVRYEDLVADPHTTVGGVLHHLGVTVPSEIPTPVTARQSGPATNAAAGAIAP